MPDAIAKDDFVDHRYGTVKRGDKLENLSEAAEKELREAGLVDDDAKPRGATKDAPAAKTAPTPSNKMAPPAPNKSPAPAKS